MKLEELPREIIELIFQHLSKYDLRNISLVNRAMRELAAVETWSTVHIGTVKRLVAHKLPIRGVDIRTTQAYRRFLKEFDRSLLRFVKTLHIGSRDHKSGATSRSWFSSGAKGFDELLKVMSVYCTNLQRLRYETRLVDGKTSGKIDVEVMHKVRDLFQRTPEINIMLLSLQAFEVSQLPANVTGLEMDSYLRSLQQDFLRTIAQRCQNMEYMVLLNGMHIYNLDWLASTVDYLDLDQVRFSENRRFWDGQRGHPVRDHVTSPSLKYLRLRKVDRKCLAMLDCPVLETLVINEHDCDPTREIEPVVEALRRCPAVRRLSIHGCNYELLAELLDKCSWRLEKLVVLGPHNNYDNKHELEAAALGKFTDALAQHKSLRCLLFDKFDHRLPYPEPDRGDDFLVWGGGEMQRSWKLFDLALLFEPLALNCAHISLACVKIFSFMAQEKRYISSSGLSAMLHAVILPTSTAVTQDGQQFAELYATKYQPFSTIHPVHRLNLHAVAQLRAGVPVEGSISNGH